MRVLLAGASGVFGGPLVRQLIAAGHHVSGTTRSGQGADRIRQLGATPIQADVLDRDALLTAVDGKQFDAVIHELTALKKAPRRHSDMHQTDELRITGSRHLIEAAQATGARRFLTQSIVFGYGYTDHGATPLTEDSPFGVLHGDGFDPHLEAMVSAENQATSTPGIDGIPLRYGLLYGADIDTVVSMLRKRALPVVRGGGELAFVHHEDAASATVAALDRGHPGRAYNVVDDTPATFAELITRIAEATHSPRPLVMPRWLLAAAAPYGKVVFGKVSMRVSNARAKDELAWHPRYPSILDGVPVQ
jgi:nucleoside-diphosphate-sugar epimerase